MEGRFFAPLGMRRTLLGMVSYCSGDAACGYSKTPLGVTAITPWKSDWTYSAGGVTSTAADLARWDIALMSGRILNSRDFALMTTPRRDSGYGYGVFAYSENRQWVVWHDGTVYGFKAMNSLVLPDRDAVVVLCNADYAHAAIVAMKIQSVLFHTHGGEVERPDVQLPLFAFSLAALFGLLPVAAMVIFRRRLVLGSVCAVLAYLAGIYFWPAGLAVALAGIIFVCWKPAKEKSPPVMHVGE
jgi:CubicO group peptidase (beta-lactamase class C family)